jgi:predicted porin
MKKTIVAAAIAAVVSAPAFADVSISGKVLTTIDNIGKMSSQNSTIKFSGSEDLGNGMKAGFVFEGKMPFDKQNSSADGAINHGGKAKYGYVDFGGVTASAGYIYAPGKALFGASGTAIGEDSVSDNTKFVLQDTGADGVSLAGKVGDMTVVVAATEGGDGEVSENSHVGVMGNIGGAFVGVSQDSVGGVDTVSLAAKFSMGDTTIGAFVQDNDTDQSTLVALTHKMGANTFAVSMGDNGSDKEGYSAKITHSLSKATNVFVSHQNVDGSDSQSDIGLQVSF